MVHLAPSKKKNNFIYATNDTREGVGRDWYNQVYTRRRKNDRCRSFPPAPPLPRLADYWRCSLPAVCKTKLNAFASMLPPCVVHTLNTMSLHFFRLKLNGCCFWDGSIVCQHLARFTTSVVCHLWHLNLSEWHANGRIVSDIAFPHRSDSRLVRNWKWIMQHREWKFAMAVTSKNPLLRGTFSMEK